MQLRLLLAAVLGIALCDPALATLPGTNPELDRLYDEARQLLDGPRSGHRSAAEIIRTILTRDPEYAGAYVEAARYSLKSSYARTLNGRDEFSERGIADATRLLDRAIELEPAFAESFVLYGYVLGAQYREVLGLAALDEAERLGSRSVWLSYNRAQLHELLGRHDDARAQYLATRASAARGSPQDATALEGLTRTGNSAAEVDGFHRELLALRPDDVWARTAYAAFLVRDGRIDAAIEQARAALNLQPHEFAREWLALALYTKASQLLLEDKDEARAAEYFAQADAVGYAPEELLVSAAAQDSTFIAVLGMHTRGADIDTTDTAGQTALFSVLQRRDEGRARTLLERGANPNVRDDAGWTPLLLAVNTGSLPLVALLIDAGADPNLRGPEDETAIEVAAAAGHSEIAARLAAAGGAAAVQPWRAIVAGVGEASPAAIDQAVKYLHFEEPENADVLAALQGALVSDPQGVLELTADYGFVTNGICGPAASRSAPSAATRLEALQLAYERSGSPSGPSLVATCASRLRRTQADAPIPSLAGPVTDARRAELLTTARRLFEESRLNSLEHHRAREIAYRLSVDDRDSQANILVAELHLASAHNDASRGVDASQDVAAAITTLERTLQANDKVADAFGLYSHALRLEGHHGLGDVTVRRAEALGNAGPWLAIYQAEALVAAADTQGAVQRLQSIEAATSSRRIYAESRRQLVEAFRQSGQPARARAAFEELIAVDAADAAPLRQYLLFLLYEDVDFAKAVEVGMRLNDVGAYVDDNKLFALALFARGSELQASGAPVAEVAEQFKRGERQAGDLGEILARAAANPGMFAVVRALRNAGLSVNVADDRQNTPLLHAVARDDREAVAELLSLGADVNMSNESGITPLQLAILSGHAGIAMDLVAGGAETTGSLPDGSSLEEAALAREMDELRARIADTYVGRYPDWDTFVTGTRAAQPVHLRRALTLSAQPEVLRTLETAMRTQPRTVIELASENGKLATVCGPSAETSPEARARSVQERTAAVTAARSFERAVQLAPPNGAIDRCLQLLAAAATR